MLKPVDYVLVAIIALVVALALRKVISNVRKGGCSCSSGCTGCTGGPNCPHCKAREQ